MDNNQLASLLNVIDNRAKKVLADSKPTYRSLAQVYAIDPANPNFPRVKLAGYTSASDDDFPCYNLSGGDIQIGDWVYLLTNGNDLNTAVIIGGKESGGGGGELSFYVTPQMYGAKADGTTDDTVAIQSALDSGMPVFFPQGQYLTTSLHPSPNGLRLKGVSKLSLYGQPYVGSIILYNGNTIPEDNLSLFAMVKNSTQINVTTVDRLNGYVTVSGTKALVSLKIGNTVYDFVTYGTEVPNVSCSYDNLLQRIKFANGDSNFVNGATIDLVYYSTGGYSCNIEGMRFHNNLYSSSPSSSTRLFMSSVGGNFFNNTVLNFNQIFGSTATAHISCNYFGNIREYFANNVVDTTILSNYINGTVDTGYAWQGCVINFQCASSMLQGNYIDYFNCFTPKSQITITTTSNTTINYQAVQRHNIRFGATVVSFNTVKIGYTLYQILPEGSTPVAGLSCVEKLNQDPDVKYATLTFAADDTNFVQGNVVTVNYQYYNTRFLTNVNITGNTFDEMYTVFVNQNIESVSVVGNTFFRINGTKEYNVEYDRIVERTSYAEIPWEICNFSTCTVKNFTISDNSISQVNRIINTNNAWYMNGIKCSGNKGSILFLSDMDGYVPYNCQEVSPQDITSTQQTNHTYNVGATNILKLTEVYIDVYSGGQLRYTQTYNTSVVTAPVADSTCQIDRATGVLTFADDDTLFVQGNKIHFNYYLMSDYSPWVFAPYNGASYCNNDIYIDLMENRQVDSLPTAWVSQGNKLYDTYPMNHLIYSGDLYVNLPTYDALGIISSCEWKKLTGGSGVSTPMRVHSENDWVTLNVSTE